MTKIALYTPQDFKAMAKAGHLAAQALDYITPHVQEGITTEALDTLCHTFIIDNKGVSATIGYRGYTKASCISINHVVCHGIPGSKKLQNGDIVNIDVTVIVDGWFGDTSRMYYVGKPPLKAIKLVETTYEAMMRGIEVVKPGNTFGDIGHVIQKFAESKGYSVVRDFCGHGIGRQFHMEPQVLHYGRSKEGMTLEKGMIFTIEPMINIGGHEIKILEDGWTAVTRDRSLSAQFEHTIGVTETGYEIFTLSPEGYTLPPYNKSVIQK